jgi:hypothetical protein
MVHLDLDLIAEAQRMANGANIHRIKQLVFAYEQAVLLHNSCWPAHDIYHSECEQDLRRYLARHRNSPPNLRVLQK